MSAPPTYRSKGRSWVKLWVGEWLDGTTRYEMTGAQRAFWVDLLTLAGRSRTPGVVCANSENAGLFGYPLARYEGILGDPSVNVLDTLKLFESQGKIELIVTRQEQPTLYVVKILSWERYQSEYMRQRKTRKGAYKVTPIVTTENTTRCAIEGEVEVEEEGEVERETSFSVFWDLYPRKVGVARALNIWQKMTVEEKAKAFTGLKLWKQAEQWNRDGGKFIPHGSTFLAQRRWEDEPWTGAFEEQP